MLFSYEPYTYNKPSELLRPIIGTMGIFTTPVKLLLIPAIILILGCVPDRGQTAMAGLTCVDLAPEIIKLSEEKPDGPGGTILEITDIEERRRYDRALHCVGYASTTKPYGSEPPGHYGPPLAYRMSFSAVDQPTDERNLSYFLLPWSKPPCPAGGTPCATVAPTSS